MTTVSDNGEDPTPEPTLSAQAFRAAQDGERLDPRAFHHKHAATIRGIITNRVSDPEAVEDIRQEAWASFFKSSGLTKNKPVAFLVSIVRRRVVDYYRRAAACETCTAEEALRRRQDELLRDRLANRISDDVITKVDVERALADAELTDEHRLLLHLHYIDGLDPDTVADTMHISRATFFKWRRDVLTELRTSPHLTSYQPITDQEEVQ